MNTLSADQIESANEALSALCRKHGPHRSGAYQGDCELCIYMAEAMVQDDASGSAYSEAFAFLDTLTVQTRADVVKRINSMFIARPPLVRPPDETENKS